MATVDRNITEEMTAHVDAASSRLEMRVAQREAMSRGAIPQIETLLKAVEQARWNPAHLGDPSYILVKQVDWEAICKAARKVRG